MIKTNFTVIIIISDIRFNTKWVFANSRKFYLMLKALNLLSDEVLLVLIATYTFRVII